MKKAIHQIAAEIVAEQQKPMSVEEIYEAIANRNLYEFKSQSPKSVLRNQLRRYSANVMGPHQAKDAKFTMSADGKFSVVK